MIETVLNGCIVALLLALPLLVLRMIKGPTVMDRLLCFDAFSLCIITIIVLLFMKWKSSYYVDIVLVFSLFGFFSTVVFAYYLHKTYMPHPSSEKKPEAALNEGDTS